MKTEVLTTSRRVRWTYDLTKKLEAELIPDEGKSLKEEVAALAEGQQEQKSAIEAMQSKIDLTLERVRSIDSIIKRELDGDDPENLKGDVSHCVQRVHNIEDTVGSLERQLSKLAKTQTEQFAKLDELVDADGVSAAVATAIEPVVAAVGSLKSSVGAQETQLQALKKSLGTVQQSIDDLLPNINSNDAAAISSLTGKVDAMQQCIDDLAKAQEEERERHEEEKQKQQEAMKAMLEAATTEMMKAMTQQMQAEFKRRQKQERSLNAKLDAILTGVTNMEQKVAEASAQSEKDIAELQKLQGRLVPVVADMNEDIRSTHQLVLNHGLRLNGLETSQQGVAAPPPASQAPPLLPPAAVVGFPQQAAIANQQPPGQSPPVQTSMPPLNNVSISPEMEARFLALQLYAQSVQANNNEGQT